MRNMFVLMVVVLVAIAYGAEVNLQAAYDACGPGEGFDKLLVLDANNTYTGGLLVDETGGTCIHGNGAVIDLGASGTRESIMASGSGTLLAIDGCVIIHGDKGVAYEVAAWGNVINCTFYDNNYGVYVWGNSSVDAINNIFSNGTATIGRGLGKMGISETYIQYNNCWQLPGGDYMEYCVG